MMRNTFCVRSLTATLLTGVCLSAQANTVGWWRMEGTSGELAKSIANEIDPAKFAAVWNNQGTASRFSETFVVPVSHVGENRASASIAAVGTEYANMHKSRFEVADDSSHGLRPASFTLEAFFKWNAEQTLAGNATAGVAGYIHDSSVIACSYGIGIYGNSVIAKFYDGSDRTLTGSSGTPRDGKWHHLAVTFDHATKKAELWLDYKFVGTMTLAADLVYADKPLCIGSFGERGMIGWVDEVRLSDCVLSADEFLDARMPKRCLLPADEPAETLFRYRMGDAVRFPDVFVGADAACGWCAPLPDATLVNLADWTTAELQPTVGGAAPTVCVGDTPGRMIRYGVRSSEAFADEMAVSFADAGAYRFSMADKDLVRGGDFTAELFLKTEARPEYVGLIRQMQGDKDETATTWQIGMRDSGALVFSSSTEVSGTYNHYSFGSVYDDGLWHHVAAVYLASTPKVRLYFDGRLVAEHDLPRRLSEGDASVNMLIGRRAGGFDGLIDEVRITGRALDPDEFLTMPPRLVHYGFDGNWSCVSTLGTNVQAATLAAHDGGNVPSLASANRAGKYLYSCHTNVSAETLWSTNAQYVTIDRGQVTMLAGKSRLLRADRSTVEAFVRFPSGGSLKQYADVLALFDNNDRIWTVRVDAGSKLYILFNGTSSIFKGADGAKALNDGQWHHLALTLNASGSPTRTEVALFVDYDPYVSGTVDGAIPYKTSSDSMKLCASSNNSNNFQAFDLDEVRYVTDVKEPGDFIGFGRYFSRLGLLLIYR